MAELVPAPPSAGAKVLLVDDEPALLHGVSRLLTRAGYDVVTAGDGATAVELISTGDFDVVVSDISMPGMNGLELMGIVRERDLDVPVIMITGGPTVQSAVEALQHGAVEYLMKPVDLPVLKRAIEKAVRLHEMAKMKRDAMVLLGTAREKAGDHASLSASFDRAVQSLWIAYQPIVDARDRSLFGYEALVRTSEPTLPHPGALLSAAERLNRLDELGRVIRSTSAAPIAEAPERGSLFVNLHARDLLDETLFHSDSPLSKVASRVVLEITERASLDEVKDVRARVADLRSLGFRIAIDDLGAGYAGLTSFATLEPEIVKLDMSLVRDVHKHATKQKLIRSMTALCKDMGMAVVAEGVETAAERDALVDIGCDLLQGYFFAKPGRAFPEFAW